VTDDLSLEPHTEEVEMSNQATDDMLTVSAAAPAVPPKDLISSISSEKSHLDSDTDSEPVFEIPPNMLLKLPKAARDWKVVAKNLSKNPSGWSPIVKFRLCNKLAIVHNGLNMCLCVFNACICIV
jgi:hypothetical protein